jgi:hypothetical protein
MCLDKPIVIMKAKIILIFVLLWAFAACVFKKNDAQHDAARPDAESIEKTKLSSEDKARLALAMGRSATPVNTVQLKKAIDKAGNKLHLFAFWKLGSQACFEQLETIKRIEREYGDKISVVYVNLDAPTAITDVDVFIRQYDFTGEVWQCADDGINWHRDIYTEWSGRIPAVYLVNATNGVKIFYAQTFEYQEFLAILQPLL